MSIATIHHLASQERRIEALAEISRLLRVGGTALVFAWAFNEDDSNNRNVNFYSFLKFKEIY